MTSASNWISPDKVLKLVSLVKTGKTFGLGHVYERAMPMPGQRTMSFIAGFIP
jgi:hypothetical protein